MGEESARDGCVAVGCGHHARILPTRNWSQSKDPCLVNSDFNLLTSSSAAKSFLRNDQKKQDKKIRRRTFSLHNERIDYLRLHIRVGIVYFHFLFALESVLIKIDSEWYAQFLGLLYRNNRSVFTYFSKFISVCESFFWVSTRRLQSQNKMRENILRKIGTLSFNAKYCGTLYLPNSSLDFAAFSSNAFSWLE